MNETYEREINLKWLFYRVLRAWKSIVLWSILVAFVLGLGSAGLKAVRYLDTEFMEEEKLNFERKHAAWWAMKENYRISLENLEESKARQEEYNEKSIMMAIDPMKKTVASFELYVKYDYKIDPTLTAQNPDLSDRILRSYATYMTNGEMYHYIMQNLSYDIELRYLTEILGVSVDYGNNFITVSVVHTNEEACQEILTLAKSGIESRTSQIIEMIDEHSINLSNQVAYEVIDLSLKDSQEANRQAVVSIDASINALNQARIKWEKGDIEVEEGQDKDDILTGIEPEFEYDPIEILKDAIKMAIIGGVVTFVLFLVAIVAINLLSGKLLNPDDMKDRYGLRMFGVLPTERAKKPFASITSAFAKACGIKIKPEEYDVLCKIIGANIKSDLISGENSKSYKSIAFTGFGSAEEMEKAVAAMNIEGYSVVCAPDILTKTESIEKITSADCVVLVETQEKSLTADIEKELETLKIWNKPVLGAVVLNTDAIM